MRKLISSIIVSLSMLIAGDKSNIGTAGALELRLSADPQAVAFNYAYSGMTSGLSSVMFNPAGLIIMNSEYQFKAQTMDYLVDSRMNEIGFAMKISENSAIAVNFRSIDIGDIEQTTLQNPNGNGVTFAPVFSVLSFSWSQRFTDKVSFGATIHRVTEEIINTSASALALTLGIQYRTDSGIGFGMALKNTGSDLVWNGSDEQYVSGANNVQKIHDVNYEGTRLPTSFEISVNYKYTIDSENNLTLLSTFENHNFALDDVVAGLEYAYNDMFFLRMSSRMQSETKLSAFTGFAFGVGANFELSEGSNIEFDYAFKQSRDTDVFDNINVFGLKLNF